MDFFASMSIIAYAVVNVATIPVTYIPFATFVGNIIQLILLIAGILATIFLIVAGIQYITAGGDPTKTSAARQGIVNTIIGIIVILIAFSIVSWVTSAVISGKPL